ncbi:MAG: dihydrofolate reductase [Spirochaetales bacterium]|nr:dihydrofolate reductase [Spirochaetales bacterium]
MTKYSIIVATAENLVIGKDNKIPWHVSEDLKLFKRRTTDNIIIMGRKTFESIGKPLPGRHTIVITKSPADFNTKYADLSLKPKTSLRAEASIEDALSTASEIEKTENDANEIFVAGGASIYKQTIDGAEKLYISRVPIKPEGDTFFPEIKDCNWNLETKEEFDGFRLETYLRK